MFERLIENWLTNVNELGMQIPFCEMLLARGYRVLHISRHSRGEHGKDVVARAEDGSLWTFQMKGGDITFTQWRNELRSQIEDLVRLPVLLPGVTTDEPHTPVLVTNGELRGDALDSARYYADVWAQGGHGKLQVWQRSELHAMFVEAHGAYLPTRLTEFRAFVELYVADGKDRLPRAQFADFLEGLVESDRTGTRASQVKRGIESMILLGSYILEQYERAGNHIAAAEGWTIIGAVTLYVVERERLEQDRYEASLTLARAGLESSLAALEAEILERENFVECAYVMAEPIVYGARTTLTLGWLAAYVLLRLRRGEHVTNWKQIFGVVRREASALRMVGESDWPAWVSLAMLVTREYGAGESEALIAMWVRSIIKVNRGADARGLPNPYWTQEKGLAWGLGELPKHEVETFSGQSYTLLPALDMLVRRMRRQLVRHLWPDASRLLFVNFQPDETADWFLWSNKRGETRIVDPEQPQRWSSWRMHASESAAQLVPTALARHPDWILPFALAYPHRMNRALTRFVDEVFRERRI